MGFKPSDFAQRTAKPRKARRPGSDGKHLESLVVASRLNGGACIERIADGAKRCGKFVVPVKQAFDFCGTLPGGRAIMFDAKECGRASFHASESNVKQHQVDRLIAMGKAGAVAGLLVLYTTESLLWWLDWRALVNRQPTYRWVTLPLIGRTSHAIDWNAVQRAADAAGGSE